MLRKWLPNIGLAIGSIVFFMLVIEFGLRITGLQTVKPNPPQIYVTDPNPKISYTLKPSISTKAFRSTVTTDKNGFRVNETSSFHAAPENAEKIEEQKIGKPNIAVLGDSITFGYGVENDETLPAKLEELIPEFHFMNTGVPGYFLSQEVALYNKITRKMDPEAIILVFYWNDLNDYNPGILDEQGILRTADWKPEEKICDPIEEGILGYLPGKCWLDTHSAFYKAYKKLVNMVDNNRDLEAMRKDAQAGDITDPVDMKNLETYIEQLSTFTDTIPVDHYFVIWPDRYVHTESKAELINAAKKLEYTVIDLTEIFGNNAKTLGWDTVHPHPETIEKAAAYIRDAIEKSTL